MFALNFVDCGVFIVIFYWNAIFFVASIICCGAMF